MILSKRKQSWQKPLRIYHDATAMLIDMSQHDSHSHGAIRAVRISNLSRSRADVESAPRPIIPNQTRRTLA